MTHKTARSRIARAQPAFYARTGAPWGDLLTLLHLPYTAWHLSYVVYGASVAAEIDLLRLGGTLAAFFLFVMGVGSAGYALTGLLTAERLVFVLVAIVPVLAGFRVSAILLRRMDRDTFRKAVLALIVAASLAVLVRELASA